MKGITYANRPITNPNDERRILLANNTRKK